MKRMKINDDTSSLISHIVKKYIMAFGVMLCLIIFPAIADDTSTSEETNDKIVEQVDEKSSDSKQLDEDKKTTDKDATEQLDEDKKTTDKDATDTDSEEKPPNIKKEVITGTSDKMERDQKAGITILIGNAKTIRKNEDDKEIGFLNADTITLVSDLDTRETKEIIAVGNVEIRDEDIFATCDHATMNNLTNIITLKDNVVVLQNNDRLETKLFTFDRTTGKQTGVGDVKFKVTVTQTVPDESEDSTKEGEEGSETTSEGDQKVTAPETKDGEKKESEETDTEESSSSTETTKEKTEPAESEETEPAESEETEPAESEETEPAESEETEPAESEETEPAESEETEPAESEEEDEEEAPEEK